MMERGIDRYMAMSTLGRPLVTSSAKEGGRKVCCGDTFKEDQNEEEQPYGLKFVSKATGYPLL